MKKVYGNSHGKAFRAYDSHLPRRQFLMEVNDYDWSVIAVSDDSERRPLTIDPLTVRNFVQRGTWTETPGWPPRHPQPFGDIEFEQAAQQ